MLRQVVEMAGDDRLFDVAVIGSGLAGSTLGAILARHGHAVVLLEAGSHPRFAVGESVVPEFGARARLLADTFGVPELGHMSSFQLVRHHVSANCGIKRNFSFLVHREGQEHAPAHSCQFRTMSYPLGPDTHVYRPDLDAWLTAVAVRYGAVFRERAPVREVTIGDKGVEVTAGSSVYRARFLADASGFRSVLADREGLREPTTLATDSRTLFTHMVGVRAIRETREESARPMPSPPDQGTMHHIFDGGWFWVIPFNNHSRSVNPVCSVGLTLDRRRHPDNGIDPETEFFAFVNRFPTIARQFHGARAIRSWVKTGRVQYQSSRLTGPRWCLLPHAANFIDALFSGGMTQTLVGVNGVARLLLDALKHDRCDPSIAAAIEEGAREDRTILDRIVHGAFVAFRSHAFFNAWFRIWAVGNFHASAGLSRLHLKYLSTGDRDYLGKVNEAPYRRVLGMDSPRLRGLLDDGYRLIEAFERSEIDEPGAVEAIYALLRKQDWIPPHFRIGRPDRPYLASFTALPLLSLMLWGKRHAPADMRDFYYDVGPIFFWELVKALAREGRRGLSGFARVVLDAHYSRGRS